MSNPVQPMLLNEDQLAALTATFQEHRAKLRTMLQHRIDPTLNPRIDADDLVNETFIAASRRWTTFPSLGISARAWLYRLALDCLIEAWRRETRAVRNVRQGMPWPEQSSVQLGMCLMGPGTTPSEALARKELCQRVQEALDELSDIDREILRLRHFDNLPNREIAEILDIQPNAATRRYIRAVERLRPLLADLAKAKGLNHA